MLEEHGSFHIIEVLGDPMDNQNVAIFRSNFMLLEFEALALDDLLDAHFSELADQILLFLLLLVINKLPLLLLIFHGRII